MEYHGELFVLDPKASARRNIAREPGSHTIEIVSMLRNFGAYTCGAVGTHEFESMKSRNKQSALQTKEGYYVNDSSASYDRDRDVFRRLDQLREICRNSRHGCGSRRIFVEFSERTVVIEANHKTGGA